MEQWCNLFPWEKVWRLDTPTEPKFARCKRCLDTFGLGETKSETKDS